MRQPRVTVLYNEPTLPADHPDADSEHDILYTADCVAKALVEAGLPVARLGITADPTHLIDGLKAQAPDVVFNLYEGTAKWGNTEAYVCGILELLGIPFTGSPTQPILLARSKPLTKQLLFGAGLPTAAFFSVDRLPLPDVTLPWPLIVKPGLEDASIGIEQKSVVTNRDDLIARIEYVLTTYGGSALVEQFVRGREFNVPVWDRGNGPEPLPFTEILFLEQDGDDPLWPIVSFDAKWKPSSRDFKATPAKNPAENVSPELHALVSEVAVRAFELVGCRDYARIDLRVDEAGQPCILEVNPNPCISPLAGVAASLETAKVPYGDFILALLRSALRRGTVPELANFHTSEAIKSAPASEPTERRKAWKVRPATPDDTDDLIDLLSTAETLTQAERATLAKSLRSRSRRKEWGGSTVLVLAGRTRLGGFAIANTSNAAHGTTTIELAVIDPSLRRNGWGRVLLNELERAMASIGGRLLSADTTTASLAASVRQFLTRCGYRPSGEVPEYYKDGSSRITFTKQLPVVATVPSTVAVNA
jgi:D-alanine-D-alanine ligase